MRLPLWKSLLANEIPNPSIGRCLLHDCFYKLQRFAQSLGAESSNEAVTLEESPSNGILNPSIVKFLRQVVETFKPLILVYVAALPKVVNKALIELGTDLVRP